VNRQTTKGRHCSPYADDLSVESVFGWNALSLHISGQQRMSQDLARIRAFVQVFDAGGFSAAARQHGRSKALLSKYVTDLEDYLGVRLMNRTDRKPNLTEAGEAYYRQASQLLAQLDDLDASILDQTTAPRGLL